MLTHIMNALEKHERDDQADDQKQQRKQIVVLKS